VCLLDRPFTRSSDSVYIIGGARSSRDDVDWGSSAEFWALNESYRFGHLHMDVIAERGRWFQMHPAWDVLRAHNFNDPNHRWWLTNQPGECRACWGKGCEQCDGGMYTPKDRPTGLPIYTLEPFSEIPGSVQYPMQDILDSYGENSVNVKWHTSSFAYMVPLAIHMGFKRIIIRGWEQKSDTEYREQRPASMMWLGVAIGKGIVVDQPADRALMGGNDVLYGYEKLPGYTAMHAEILHKQCLRDLQKHQALVNAAVGRVGEVADRLKQAIDGTARAQLARDLQAAEVARINAMMALNTYSGAVQVARTVLNQIRGVPSPDEIKTLGYQPAEPRPFTSAEMAEPVDEIKHEHTHEELIGPAASKRRRRKRK